jgi:hypothetical protein
MAKREKERQEREAAFKESEKKRRREEYYRYVLERDAVVNKAVVLMLVVTLVAADWTRRNEPRKAHHLLEMDWITMIVRVDDPPLVVIQDLDRDPRLLIVPLLDATVDPALPHRPLDKVDILVPHPLVVDGIRTRDHLPLVDRIAELDLGLRLIRG